MTPYRSTIHHDPTNNSYGDCFRACLASLLDIEPTHIPHFWSDGSNAPAEITWLNINSWLIHSHKLRVLLLPLGHGSLHDTLTETKTFAENCYYLLMGETARNTGHCVIALNDRIVHNPSIGTTLIRPNPTTGWLAGVLISAKHQA